MAETQSETPDPCSCLVPTTFHVKGSRGGPLSGLSFVAKDLFAVKRHTSSFGHARWRDTHTESATTAPAVLDLLDAGADLVGMAKMDQLAYSLIGDAGEGIAPVNFADPDLYCGGSSSGSAAAVASGLADFALGSDTAGSIRVPAAVCGLVGIRPTHGSISCDSVIPLAPSFDVVGFLAASATTLRDVFTAVAPTLSHDRTPTRVQIAADLFSTVGEQTARMGSHVAELAATLTGNQLEEIRFRSFTSPDVGGLFARLQSREIWGLHAEWVGDNAPALADDVRERLERCKQLSLDSDVVQRADLSRRREFRERFAEAIPPDTIVVLPVLPERGPKRDWAAPKLFDFRTRCFQLTAPAGLAGAPQVVWSARTTMGRPVGIGLLAAPGEDHLLLAMLNRLNDDPTVTRPVRTHSMQPPQP